MMGNKQSQSADERAAVAARYPPLRRLLAQCAADDPTGPGRKHAGRKHAGRNARRVRDKIAPKLARALAACEAAGARILAPHTGDARRGRHVRFVCVSDTHGHHRRVALPDGDVLVHCGDVVGNYGDDCDLAGQWRDFVRWLHDQSARYARIVFIAGNHDTLLDFERYDTPASRAAAATLAAAPAAAQQAGGNADGVLRLPPNVVYLCNSGTSYRGLRLWGCPATPSREECYNKRYYSDAFETYAADRRKLYAAVPEGVDVLLTHAPAAGTGLSQLCVGDDLLAKRLRAMAAPPRFHVCGHDHDYLGFALGGKKKGKHNAAKKAPAKQKARPWVKGADGEWIAAGAPSSPPPVASGMIVGGAATPPPAAVTDAADDSSSSPTTVHVNAAQLTVVRAYPSGGGCALVFDVPVPAE